LDFEAVVGVLAAARDCGVDTIDTAPAYGSSEEVLGRAGTEGMRIVTKIPPLPDGSDPFHHVRESIDRSLRRLSRNSVDAVLLHRGLDLAGVQGAALHRALLRERDAGRCARIGVSVYGPIDLDQLPSGLVIDLVQAPLNALDRRMEQSGWLDKLFENGVSFHARSVFLQGLLLLPPAGRPPSFARWEHILALWDSHASNARGGPLAACLNAVIPDARGERVVVGVDSLQQFRECVSASLESEAERPRHLSAWDMEIPAELVDPRSWVQS